MRPSNQTTSISPNIAAPEIEFSHHIGLADGCPPGFDLRPGGVYMHNAPRGHSGSDDASVRICGPAYVEALTRSRQGEDWGRVVRWRDLDGRVHRRAIPAPLFHDHGNVLAKELATEGLEIIPGFERKVMVYLGSFHPVQRALCVDSVGWMDSPDGALTFVLPGRAINPLGGDSIVFQPAKYSPTAKTISSAGTLDQWQDEVAGRSYENPLLLFAICASLAGPLIKPADFDGGGFHLYGASSRGKTTWLQGAASVWGCGADPSQAGDHAMLRRWTVTANGAEGLAAAHNDLVLPLDEIGSCTARDFGSLVYMLSSGQGKAVMTASRNLKSVNTWRTMILSTGESTSRQQIENAQQSKAHAGQLLRLVDVPGGDQIIMSTRGTSPAEYADSFKTACGTYYGTAGPAFVERLITEYGDLQSLRAEVGIVMGLIRNELALAEAGAELARVIKRFALVACAGVLACRLRVLRGNEERIIEAVRQVRDLWLTDSALIPDAYRGVIAIKNFILRNQASFRAADYANDGFFNLVGYRKQGAFMLTPGSFKDACGGLNSSVVARELKRLELLECNDSSHLTKKVTIQGLDSRPRLYVVRESILDLELGDH